MVTNVKEITGVSWQSEHTGGMHLCLPFHSSSVAEEKTEVSKQKHFNLSDSQFLHLSNVDN